MTDEPVGPDSRTKAMGEMMAQFATDFSEESDRSAVILGVARIDLALLQLLTAFLKPSTGSRDELLERDGPFSTLSARIILAHRLGLISDSLARALHMARKIRNDFAHESGSVSLDSGTHRDRVRALVLPLHNNPKTSANLARIEHMFSKSTGHSRDFRLAIMMIVIALEFLPLDLDVVAPNHHAEYEKGWD